MKKKAKRTVALSLLCSLALAVGGGYASHALSGADGETEVVWGEAKIEREYQYGIDFTVPTRKIQVGEEKVAVAPVLIYPDGTATDRRTVRLYQSGEYTVSYTANIDGKIYTEEDSFLVHEGIASVSSEKSSVTYGKSEYAREKSGLMVRLAKGDTLRFTQAIDLSTCDRFDSLVKCFITPDIKSAADFERLFFTFTDAENPDDYFTISARIHIYRGASSTIFSGAANGQPMSSYCPWEPGKGVHVNSEIYGAQAPFAFELKDTSTSVKYVDDYTVSLSYCQNQNMAYANNTMIIDFDDPSHFNTLWDGFDSDKVFLSVSADTYISDTANFCISSVYGLDLKASKFVDTEKPVIDVDIDKDNLPVAKKGVAYPVPEATANDFYSGDLDVQTRVWYNFGTSNAQTIPVQNGTFIPTKVGDYTIEYTAKDKAGNTATELLWVESQENPAMVELQLGAYTQTGNIGSWIDVAPYEVVGITTGVNVEVFATIGETRIDCKDGFLAEQAGDYTVHYLLTDYIGRQIEETYALTVVDTTDYMFIDTPLLPKFMIDNSGYTIPEYQAYVSQNGTLVARTTTIKMIDAEGEKAITPGVAFVPKVTNSGDKVTFRFSCGEQFVEYQVPCVKVWEENVDTGRKYLAVNEYFYGEGFDLVHPTDTSIIQVVATQVNSSWMYVNPLLAEDFELTLGGDATKTTFTGLQVEMVDLEGKVSLIINLENTSRGTMVSVCGKTFLAGEKFANGDKITLAFRNNKLYIGNAELDLGEDFTGFATEKIYFGITLVNGREGSAYSIDSICGVSLGNRLTKTSLPKIVVLGELGGMAEQGSTVTIPQARAMDTLDPNVVLTMSVTDSEGNFVTDTEGTVLNNVPATREYTINLQTYGKYTVSFTASDTFVDRANRKVDEYTIIVEDNVAPVIKFAHSIKANAKVGDTLILPNFTVSDNHTAKGDLQIMKYVRTPAGKLITLDGNSNSIKASMPGVYEFRVVVYDAAGNMTMVRLYVTVTE